MHYRSIDPIDVLKAMKTSLRAKGLLVLETIVIPGGPTTMLMPETKYAGMRNVWFIPSLDNTVVMLKRAGFKNIDVIAHAAHTTNEQRSTAFHPEPSFLSQLNPANSQLTIEGYPAPWRAILFAMT